MKKFLSIVLCITLLVTMSVISVNAESIEHDCHDCIVVVAKIGGDASVNGNERICPNCNSASLMYGKEDQGDQVFELECIHGKKGYDLCVAHFVREYAVCNTCGSRFYVSEPKLADNTIRIYQCCGV